MRTANVLNKLITFLTILSVAVPPSLAQEITATGPQGPQVLTSANGTPLIFIQTPNANGVSHNTYSQFDVGPSGVVLNNVNANYGLTNLAGYVQGNGNLANQTASLIINEVTAGDPSDLAGYIEVGGAPANVVIANAYGITCNGCGFINTPRAVLTTGSVQMADGALRGFSVEQGTIAIGPGGLDARGVDQFDLIARKVTFDGSVHGQRIRVIAGRNDVLFATLETSAKSADGNAPEFAIDSTVLGGMYAGQISIVSTEAGVGVRAPARMSANVGEMRITSDGRLVIGEAAGAGDVNLRGRDVSIDKSLSAKGALSVEALRDLVISADATIVAEAAAGFAAGRDLMLGQRATVYSERAVTLGAVGRFQAQAGARVLSFGDLSLAAQEIAADAGSVFYAGVAPEGTTPRTARLSFSAQGAANLSSATLFATGEAVFDAAAITIDADAGLDPSRFVAQGGARIGAARLNLGRAVVEAAGPLTIAARERLVAGPNSRTVSSKALEISAPEMVLAGGLIASGEGMALNAGAIGQGPGGTISAGGGLAITAQTADLQGAVQGASLRLDASGAARLTGLTQSTSDLVLRAGDLTVGGEMRANGVLDLAATGRLALSGQLAAGDNLLGRAGTALHSTADLSSNGSISLSGASLLQDGDLTAIGRADLTSRSGDLISAGTIRSGTGTSLISGQGLTNSAGLLSGGVIEMQAPGALVNTGIGLADTNADAAGLVIRGGTVTTSGRLKVTGALALTATSGDLRNMGDLTSGGDMTLSASGQVQSQGALVALGALSLTAGGDLSTSQLLRSGAALRLQAGRDLINSGALIAEGDVTLIAGRDLVQSGGYLAKGAMRLTAGEGLTSSGAGLGGNEASAAALYVTGERVSHSGSARILGAAELTARRGDLINQGALIAQGGVRLQASGDLVNEAELISGGDLALVGGSVSSVQALTAMGSLQALAQTGTLTLAGATSRGRQDLQSLGLMTLNGSYRSTDSTIALQSGPLQINGTLLAQSINANATGWASLNGQMISRGTLALSGSSLYVTEGAQAISLGAMTLTARSDTMGILGKLQSAGPLTMAAGGEFFQRQQSEITGLESIRLDAAAGVTLSGFIQTNGTLSVTTPDAITTESTLRLRSTQGDVILNAGGRDIADGRIGAQLSGEISAGRDILVIADRVNRDGPTTAGRLASFTSRTDAIYLTGDLSAPAVLLSSAYTINNSGHILGALQANAQRDFNNSGQIDATSFALTSELLTNTASGQIAVQGDAVWTLGVEGLKNRGTINVGGLLSVQSLGDIENDGLIDAEGDLILRGDVTANRGRLEGRSINLASAMVVNEGILNSLTSAVVVSQGDLTNFGEMRAKTDLTLSGANVLNTSKLTAETGVLSVRASQRMSNGLGQMKAGAGVIFATNQDLGLWYGNLTTASLGKIASDGWIAIQGADGGAAGVLRIEAGEQLVSAGDLVIQASGVINRGTIASANGNLVLRTSGNQTNTGLLYAGGDWLMLRAGGAVLNDGGTILGAQNLVVCGNASANCLDDLAADRAASLTNRNGGRIETFAGDLVLAAALVRNYSAATLTTSAPTVSVQSGVSVGSIACVSGICSSDPVETYLAGTQLVFDPRCILGQGYSCNRYDFVYDETSTTRSQSLVRDSAVASIVAGGSLRLISDSTSNEFSLVSAAGDILISGGALSNTGNSAVEETVTTRTTSMDSWYSRYSRNQESGEWVYLNRRIVDDAAIQVRSRVTGTAFGTIEARGAIVGNITGELANGAVTSNALALTATPASAPSVRPISAVFGAISAGQAANVQGPLGVNLAPLQAITAQHAGSLLGLVMGAVLLPNPPISLGNLTFTDRFAPVVPGASTQAGAATIAPGSVTIGINLAALGNEQLFRLNGPASTSPLIETRHQFIDLSAFISSDYFLASLRFDPQITQRRLGDALVETWAVRDQLTRLTGGRILDPNLSEREQMKAMYDNAIEAAKALNLRPGVALNPAQIASLTKDVIWMEERLVSGNRVLVPQVYLAAATAQRGPSMGARISGHEIAMNVGSMTNTAGEITAANQLGVLAAGNITNSFGRIAAGQKMTLSALNGNFTNLSGLVTAASVEISALDISVATEKLNFKSGNRTSDVAGATAGIFASNDLTLSAVNDITITGADLRAGQNLRAVAGRNINLNALDLTRKANFGQGNSIDEFQSSKSHVSTLAALGGDLTVVSARFDEQGKLIGGGDIISQGAALSSAGKLSVQAAAGNVILGTAKDTDYRMHFSQGGGWLSSYTSRQESFDLTHKATTLNGGTVDVFAALELLALGGDFAAGRENLTMQGGEVKLLAATDIHASYNHQASSIFGGLFSNSSTFKDLRATALESQISAAQDISVHSASKLTLQGGQMEATGNISVRAAEGTTLLGTVNTTAHSAILHDNNGFLVTDTTKVNLSQTANFTGLKAGGGIFFDPGSEGAKLGLDPDQASLGTRALALIGIEDPKDLSKRLAIAEEIQGIKRDKPAPQEGDQTKSGPTNPAYDFASSKVAIGRPTALDGAEFAYLDTLFDQGKLTVEEMALVQHEFYKQDVSLSPAFKMLLAAALKFTGIGSIIGDSILGAFGVTSAPAWASAAATAFGTSLTTGVIEGALTGNFDIGKILEGAVFSAVSAGVSAGLNFDFPEGHPYHNNMIPGFGSGQLTVSGLLNAGLDGVLTSGLSSAYYGTDFGSGVLSSLVSYVANGIAAAGIEEVSDIYGHDRFTIEKFIAKATLNCLAAQANGADCSAGVLGTLVTDLAVSDPNWLGSKTKADFEARLELVAAIAGYIASGGKGANVSATAGSALLDFVNNQDLNLAANGVADSAQRKCLAAGGTESDCEKVAWAAYKDSTASYVDASTVTAGIILDFIPILGDVKGAVECLNELTAASCGGAVVGIVPLGGDFLKITIKKGDKAVEVIKRADDLPQITRSRLHHSKKVDEVVAELKAQGYRVGTEVSFRSCDLARRCRADIVVRDESGRVVKIVEVKTGDAVLSPHQDLIYPQISSGDAIPTGGEAKKLDLTVGIPLKDQDYPNGIPVEVRIFEGVNE